MLAIVDHRLPTDCARSLEAYGYTLIPLPSFPRLAPPVSAHPDMLVFIGRDCMITHADYYTVAKDPIDRLCREGGLRLLLSDEVMGEAYPTDVRFNAAVLSCGILGNTEALSPYVKRLAKEEGYTLLHTNQGYAKCSLCAVTDRAVITADPSILATLSDRPDMELLPISQGFVTLKGYSHGFIGGASGADEEHVFFCGDLTTHPDGERIAAFCLRHGKEPVSVGKGSLYDVGSLYFIS